jgi:hypothetical protein
MIISLLLMQLAFAAEPMKLNKVFEGRLPWKGNYTVKLELPAGWNGDPGDFTRMTISTKGKPDFVLGDKEGLQGQSIREVRILPKGTTKLGKFLQMIPSAAKGSTKFLGFDQWRGGSNNDLLYLIGLNNSGEIYIAFQSPIQSTEIRDFDGDGKFDIINKGGLGEPTGEFNFYDPYLVYRQIESDGAITFKKDEELSKKWSAANKFEWHGLNYSSDIRVDLHGNVSSK